MTGSLSRRHLLALGAVAALPGVAVARQAAPEVVVTAGAAGEPFDWRDFGTVGDYDVDWLTTPAFSGMLDNFGASPGAFHGGRFFGAFTAGTTELYTPDDAGRVWVDPEGAIDFTTTFRGLEALTARGLTPFVVLGMFPPAVSESPIRPPRAWERWKRLVGTFFRELAADPRFGPEAIASWWFEAWNEPNEGRFWSGTFEDYLALYRATSEAVVETGLPVRLGGPAIAYKPQENPDFGAPWMDRFLRFVADDPALRCDFVSLHRKGTVGDDPPDPRRLHEAATTTADQLLAIDAARFGGLTVINNEADEKVGFEVPYAPRADHHNAAWLGAVAAIHGGLGGAYRDAGLRFAAAADNANLQLVEAPFDGRRSLMTWAHDSAMDLLKVPAYGFYELLRLLGERHAPLVAGREQVFPATDLYHLATVAETHIGCLVTYYPERSDDAAPAREVEYVIRDIPWPVVNVARFQIDRERSNAYTAAGGSAANPFPVPEADRLGAIRRAQEVALARPIARGVRIENGVWRERLALEPFTTLCLWITPVDDEVPVAPGWIAAEAREGNVVLRWTPSAEPSFFGYEVVAMDGDRPGARLTPEPLRAALWVDTAPPSGRRYGVRMISASGIASAVVVSDEAPAGR